MIIKRRNIFKVITRSIHVNYGKRLIEHVADIVRSEYMRTFDVVSILSYKRRLLKKIKELDLWDI